MRFFNPLAFIGLIAIPLIIIMYLLKQKYREIQISSIQLWQKATMQSQAQKPWQKLKKNILLLLQLVACIFLIFAMSKPYITTTGELHNYILVLDSSMSMQATDQVPTRFDYAKEQINKFIDTFEPNSKISLIVMDSNPYTAFNLLENKNTAKNIIKDIHVTDSDINLELTTSLLEMLYKENKGSIYIFSDNTYKFGTLDTKTIAIGQSSQNTAVTLVSHSKDNGLISVLVKVKNYGEQPLEQSVSLYVDNLIYDTKQLELKSYEEKSVIFENLSVESSELEARLDTKDILPVDDRGFDTIANDKTKRVFISSNQNIFLEKAFSILDIELYKNQTDTIENLESYDLYVFDSMLPQELPKDGHILIINPPENNSLIAVGEKLPIENVIIKDRNLLQFATDIDFSIRESKKIEVPEWADIVIDSNATPLILMGENNGQKNVIFNFDLHNTDLPLKKEFPIFIYNLVDWYMPDNILKQNKVIAGSIVDFDLQPNIESARIISPDGEIINLAPPFPVTPFSETSKAGIYKLEQISNKMSVYNSFAVNTPLKESNLLRDALEAGTSVSQTVQNNKSIANIFIVLLLIVLAVEWYLYGNKNTLFKKRFIAVVRLTSIVLIILSFFGLSFKRNTDETTTIFVADLSNSVKGEIENIKTFINDSLETKKSNDSIGVVAFGKYASVEKSVSKLSQSIDLNSQLDKSETDIATALKLSSVLIPEFSSKSIVLISDGQENVNSLLQQAKLLKEQNIKLDIYPIKNNVDKEIQLTEIKIPKYINKNTKVAIEVKIDSLKDTQSKLKLYKGNTLAVSEDITIHKGENKFVFSDISDVGGSIIYKAEITPQEDTFIENNTAYAYTYIADAPRILILDNDDSGIEIEKMLMDSGVEIVRQNAFTAPDSTDKLLPYSSIVLADLNIDMLPPNFATVLESYVKTTGGGLIVTGGINSYALGGYRNTPIETILPVEMQLKDKTKEGNLGMIIVTDRSGSMESGEYGVSKLSLAKEAVIRAVNAMENKDSIGVIAFDDLPIWIAELQQVGENRQQIENKVAGITIGGGTSILPSLQLAYETLVNSDTKLKHIILLTDGQAEASGYENIVKSIVDNNITLSTVAVGEDSDTDLLQYLANNGKGRYYYSTVFTDLPEIFAKETFLAGKTYINNRTFYPKSIDYPAIMENINQLPVLHGYIASSAKPRADVILNSDKDDPILAVWQYGLGKSVAWTSDIDGSWSSDWLASSEGVEIFRNTIAWTLKNQMTDDISITADSGNIQAVLKSDNDIKSIKGTVISPEMKEYEIEFSPTQPRIYESTFDDTSKGIYIINLQIEKENGTTEILNTGVNINYSKEYDIRNFATGEVLLRKASEITGGRILKSPSEVFESHQIKAYGEKNITTLLLIIALILLVFEIAVRRFPIISNKLELTVSNISFILKDKDKKNIKKPKIQKPKDTKLPKETETIIKSVSTSNALAASKKKRRGR